MDYIVAYTLKNNTLPDTFIDHWIYFIEGEHIDNLKAAQKFYQQIVDMDGADPGWHLWTINLSQVIQSTDH